MSKQIDWAQVTALWRTSGRTPSTVGVYLYWARRFEQHCRTRNRDPVAHLTLDQVGRIAKEYGQRSPTSDAGRMPLVAARALSCALAQLGYRVPQWSPTGRQVRWPRLVTRYIQHRLRYRGIAHKTSQFEARCASTFIQFLGTRRRSVRTIRIVDIDAFIVACSKRFTAKTVAGLCSALRAFLRYLHMVGLTRIELSTHVAGPRIRSVDRPPRAVPWNDVRRILRAIDTTAPLGLRDKALFLMMATYGMGAGEVIHLCLEDIDWRARRIRLRRPKTGVVTELPLLDPVARALAAYLQRSRPAHASTRAVFVTGHLPHRRLEGSTTIRHRLALYAKRAGIRGGYLGTHLFRHSHATRQIEQGQPAKVVGDILGHRRPESTSVYTRSALPKLRAMALPVPR